MQRIHRHVRRCRQVVGDVAELDGDTDQPLKQRVMDLARDPRPLRDDC